MRYSIMALAGVAALLVSVSSAQAGQGWYVTGGVGGQFLDDSTDTTSDAFGNSATVKTKFDVGFGVNGAFGYSWDSYGNAGGGAVFRVEGEVLYKMNDIDGLDVTAILGPFLVVGSFDGTGDVSALGLMANAWYEFKTGMPWRPYIGGGVGMANISLNDVGITVLGIDFPVADDDDWVFAYQFGAGLNYELTRQVVVGIEYRFFATTDPEFVDVTGAKFSGEVLSHNLGLIVRFLF